MDYSLLDASHTRISPRDDYYEGPIIQNTSNGRELWIDIIHRISANSDQTEIHTLLKTRAGRRSPLAESHQDTTSTSSDVCLTLASTLFQERRQKTKV